MKGMIPAAGILLTLAISPFLRFSDADAADDAGLNLAVIALGFIGVIFEREIVARFMPTNRKFYVGTLRFLGGPTEDFIKTVKVLSTNAAVFNV